jgi:predicted transcriptional regulator
MVREFVNRVFDGASRPLLLHLVKDRSLSARERQHLRRLLEEAE